MEVSNPAEERLRTRVLHQSIIKTMSVLSSREKSFVPFFAAELPRRQGKSSFVPGMNMHGTEGFRNGGGNTDIVF